MIKLCYKSYDYKFSMDALRLYKKRTGGCLWGLMVKYLEVYGLSVANNDPLLIKLDKLTSIADFFMISEAFYCLIKQAQDGIPVEEVQDSMFRVGFLPSDRDDDMSEPYQLVFASLALEINKTFNEEVKKPVTSEQLTKA